MKKLILLSGLTLLSTSAFSYEEEERLDRDFYFGIEHVQVLQDIEGVENGSPNSSGILFGLENNHPNSNLVSGIQAGMYYGQKADGTTTTDYNVEGYIGVEILKYCNVGAYLSLTSMADMYNGEEYFSEVDDEMGGAGLLFGPRAACAMKRKGKNLIEFVIKGGVASDSREVHSDATLVRGEFRVYFE